MTENHNITTKKFDDLKICVLICTYKNAQFIDTVLKEVLQYTQNIIVVNDGSPDNTDKILTNYQDLITIIRHDKNQGKGKALKTGFKQAFQMGYEYAITMDSDLQHKAEDLEKFVDAVEKSPKSLIVGARTLNDKQLTQGSGFANKFSNFWFTVHTLHRLSDTQTGYRIYPLDKVANMHIFSSRYETELEILVRCAWKGVEIKSVPINVFYPSKEERVSSFRPAKDFTRISILNTIFTFAAFIYGYPSMLIHYIIKKIKKK